MHTPNIHILNTRDFAENEKFERALFRAFNRFDPKTLTDIFDFNFSTRRLKSKIPYEDQEVYVAAVFGTVMAAVAVNFNLSSSLQLETYGFSIEKKTDTAEGLVIFSLDTAPRKTLLVDLGKFAFDRLKEKGIRRVFGTCDSRRLKAYQLLGFEKRDERPHMGDTEYLIEMTLREDEPDAERNE